MEAYPERMETSEKKLEAQSSTRKSWRPFMKRRTVAKHCNWAPCVKATPSYRPQDRDSSVLHGDPKGAMYQKTVGATDDQFGYQHLVTGYHCQLRIDS
jgi:hypothetical protein